MIDHLRSLAKTICENQKGLRLKISGYRSSNMERILPVSSIPISLSVAAIDGGLINHRMHGLDMVIARAAGVCFHYENSILKTHVHHPNRSPESVMEIRNALDEHEANIFRSLFRLKQELTCAIETVEKFSPNMLLLDGSLLPVPSDRPPKSSKLYTEYLEVIALFSRLYGLCKSKSCDLIGVIKDSRATRISREFGMTASDSLFCDYFLKSGERTIDYTYLDSKGPDAKEDIVNLADQIRFFYLKPSELDLPLRIEILNSKTPLEKNASVIYSLSSISKAFAYPAILVEADMCAAMDGSELQSIENLLVAADVKPLRRNSRPFR